MFTGIIEQVVPVGFVKDSLDKKIFSVKLDKLSEEVSIGESIAVNGVCQTVNAINDNQVSFYAMKQTLSDTNICNLRAFDMVNIEFSLKAASKISGHFVTGHVDCLGEITNINKKNDATVFNISFPDKFAELIVEKGSIAVNGISLTVSSVDNRSFTFNALPQTMMATTLRFAKRADKVNLEFDILAKYINASKSNSYAPGKKDTKITIDFLRQKGFMA